MKKIVLLMKLFIALTAFKPFFFAVNIKVRSKSPLYSKRPATSFNWTEQDLFAVF